MDSTPVAISLDATFRDAAQLFVAHQTSDLVVEDGGRYAGILSEGDLLRALLPDFEARTKTVAGVSLEQAYAAFLDSGRFNADRTIRSIVLTRPVSLSPSDPLLKAATLMVDEHVRGLPVLEDGAIVGMLSRAKVAWAILREREPSASD